MEEVPRSSSRICDPENGDEPVVHAVKRKQTLKMHPRVWSVVVGGRDVESCTICQDRRVVDCWHVTDLWAQTPRWPTGTAGADEQMFRTLCSSIQFPGTTA